MRRPRKRVAQSRITVHSRPMLEILENRCLLDAQSLTSVLPSPNNNSSPGQASPLVQPDTSISFTVKGTAKWTDANGGTHPIPLATVFIRSTTEADKDKSLAITETDLYGHFNTLVENFDPSSNAGVFARIYADNPAAQVMPDTGGPAPTYFMDTQASGPVTSSDTIALPERDASNSSTKPDEQAFSILGAMLQAQTYAALLASGGTTSAPGKLVVRFPEIPKPSGPTPSYFDFINTQMFIAPDKAFVWDTIEHEYGHYVADKYGFFDPKPDGEFHAFNNLQYKPDGPGLGWNEGWADFYSIAAQINGPPPPYAVGVPGAGDANYKNDYNLATGHGFGELSEAGVASALYHLTVGDEGIKISAKTLFQALQTSKAQTFGALYDALAASMSGSQRSLLGQVLGQQKIAPYNLKAQPTSGSISTTNIPTFTWEMPDYQNHDDFIIQFYSSDYKTLLFPTQDLKDTFSYTPTPDEWKKIFNGHSTVKWFVEVKDTGDPVTPGAVKDQTYPDQILDRYWSEAQTLNGPSIGMVLDITGSMQPEINSVKKSLVQYITNLQNSLPPGATPPTVDLVTFIDSPMETISSNDLNAVKATIQAQQAGGGGDLPEPSAQSLAFAAQNIGPGGTLLLITDAPSDAGTDLDGTIAMLRAEGVTVNAVISGDSGYDDEPTGTTPAVGVASPSLASDPTTPASSPETTTSASSAAPSIAPLDAPPDEEYEGPQGPVTDAGQLPTNSTGDTPANATLLTVDGPIVHAIIGNQVQDSTGAAVANNIQYYSFNLVAGTSYNIPILTDELSNVTATLYDTDGLTSVASGTTVTGDPGFGYLTLTYIPKVSGTYYLSISQPDSPTGYSVQVSDNPLVGATSSVVLWTTVAAATGGEFLYKPAIVNDSSDPNVATDYQAAIVNVMDSTFAPTVLSASPNTVPAGTTLDITLTGAKTNWIQGKSNVAFSASGITVDKVTVNSPTSLTATITVDPSATLAFSNVTVTTNLGSSTETTVGTDVLQITAAPTIPTLLEVSPGTMALGGTYDVKISGTLTKWDSTSTLSLGPGVTVSNVTVDSPTEITAKAVVSTNTSIGFRVATVTTADTSATDTQDMAITLTAAPTATAISTISSLGPNQGRDGQHVSVTVVGQNTHFVDGQTTADFGPGVTVDSVSVTDASHATVIIDVNSSASPGFRNVTLTTGTETATSLDGFQILSALPSPAPSPPPSSPHSPPVSHPAPPTLQTPFLLKFIDSILGGIETVNGNGTETVIDRLFGIPLFESTYNSGGALLSVTFLGIDITFFFE